MKFEISRASAMWHDTAPCPGATLKRDKSGRCAWEIEIPDLATLLAIIAATKNDLIVGRDSITIYDDYIE